MRLSTRAFLVVGLLSVCVATAVVAPWASDSPDGLEKTAIENGFADDASEHPANDGPLAGYEVRGVEDERLSTSLSGVLGVGAVFLGTAGFLFLLKRGRPSKEQT